MKNIIIILFLALFLFSCGANFEDKEIELASFNNEI